MRELILNLHGIGEPHSEVDAKEEQCWLSMRAFTELLDQICELSNDDEPKIKITFDDGNSSDVLVALPELAKRGLAAEFFVCVGRVGKPHYLDQSMIKELSNAGMTIGSHGMNHQNWRTLESTVLDVEIVDARRKLQDITQQKIDAVAIPFGSYDRRVLQRLVQDRDTWSVIYTSDGGTTESWLRVKARQGVCDDSTINKLLASPSARIRVRKILSKIYKRSRPSSWR